MLTFKQFINEEVVPEKIGVDPKHLESNFDTINAESDVLTSKPYQNAPIFLNQLRGALQRLGVLIPASATNYFLNLSAEIAYLLGDSNKYLYMVYDTNDDGYVDGYAQIVNEEELNDLMGSEGRGVLNTDRNMIAARHSDWYRKRDDDAGNSNEYA